MDKQIPRYFDAITIDSPIQEISTQINNVGRLKVRVFTKYGNRNGSYITDEVADQLIRSVKERNIPVIGFFDPETQTWASHTGPTLANAYGYVENFLGWEPFTDTDGISREYAVFSVVLFTEYFEEARKILGQNQSMELDPASIKGDWTLIGDQEYYVYTTARMLGFCVIGSHEPCFSVSSFFSKDDDTYNFEHFSSLLSELREQVEKITKNIKGGEQPMNEFENNEEVIETETVESTPEVEEESADVVPQEEVPVAEEKEETSDFEALQQQFNDLQALYNELKTNYEAAQNQISELQTFQETSTAELDNLRAQNEQLQTTVSTYEAQQLEAVNEKKKVLIEKYEKFIDEEEIDSIRSQINDYSYDELKSKLAISFADKQMNADREEKVPLPEPQESQFALLMKKYRKN